jgi:hypothetical protein
MLGELVEEHVDLGSAPGAANAGDKAMTLIHSALAGGEWIDDADRLRAGSTALVLGHRVVAPSTLGTFLRLFTWARSVSWTTSPARPCAGRGRPAAARDRAAHHRHRLDPLRDLWASQAGRDPGRAGRHPWLAPAAGDRRRHRGCAALAAARRSRQLRPWRSQLRHRGDHPRPAGRATGPICLRADSGFYGHKVVAACRKQGVTCSITVKVNKAVRAVIAAIPEQAWTPIGYWLDGGADVAETSYRPFGRKGRVMRLLVRRVRPPPARSSPCSATTTTTRSSPTARAPPWSWRPTTAATPKWRTPSATSNTASA